MAKNYIDNLSEETKKGMLEKAEQGLYPSAAPLGYRNISGPRRQERSSPILRLAPLVPDFSNSTRQATIPSET